MEAAFVTYRKFGSLEEAGSLIELLENNKIHYELEDNTLGEDVSAVYGAVRQSELDVKILQTDFERVDGLLEKEAADTLPLLNKEYYLYEFSNEELYEVVNNFDKWNETDYLLAQKILKERGEKMDESVTKEKRKKRIKELSEPEPASSGWIAFGYISAVLGGILGIFIGYHHWKFKKLLPTGEKVFAYDEKSRNSGKNMFYIGVVCCVLWSLAYLFLI